MAIQSSIIGVNVIDVTRSGTKSTPFGRCLMIGSGSLGAIGMQTISSLLDFDTKIGSGSLSRKHVANFFANLTNTGVELLFYKVNNLAVAAVATDYINALDAINPLSYSGGILIAPEVYETQTIANRALYWAKAETFCDFAKGSIWVHLVDINPTPATPTTSDVISEKNTNYNSVMSGFNYYGLGTDSNDAVMLPSPCVAAGFLSLWTGNAFYKVFTGSNRPISGYKTLKSNFTSYDTIVKAGINPIVFDDGSYYAFSAVSGASKKAFYHLNSVVCYKVVAYFCANALKAFSNQEVAGEENFASAALATLQNELLTCWSQRKLLSGTSADLAYVVTIDTSNTSIVESNLTFNVDMRPSYVNQSVTLRFANILV